MDRLRRRSWILCLMVALLPPVLSAGGRLRGSDRRRHDTVLDNIRRALGAIGNHSSPADNATAFLPTTPLTGGVGGTTLDAVVGGADATTTEAPYFAMLLHYDENTREWRFDGCGGTLVSDRHVLTAGHCAAGRDPGTRGVYVHAHRPFAGNPGVPFHFARVATYTVHPRFNDTDNASDLALVALAAPVAPDAAIVPVRLAAPWSPALPDGAALTVYGFGWTDPAVEEVAPVLQAAAVPFLSRDECRRYFGDRVLEDMVCAGGPGAGGRDACRGDSGGPLVRRRPDGAPDLQVGIVSWGRGCGDPRYPGVYTSVAAHYDWIRGVVCREGSGTRSPLCERNE